MKGVQTDLLPTPNPPPREKTTSKKPSFIRVKIKNGYNLELQTPETMNLFATKKKLTGKTKNKGKVKRKEKLLK